MSDNVYQTLVSMEFRPRRVGDNWHIDCPFCEETSQRLGFHIDTEQWNCFNGGCDARGKTLKGFKLAYAKKTGTRVDLKEDGKKSAPAPKEKLETTKSLKEIMKVVDQDIAEQNYQLGKKKGRLAHKYLRLKRGFSDETIEHFKLGSEIRPDRDDAEYISIPFFEGKVTTNIKYRWIKQTEEKKNKWIRIKGGKSSLYNHNALLDKPKTIILTEAELDCISAWNNGFKNVVSIVTGAKSWQAEYHDLLKDVEKIYLCYDNDEDGQLGARKIASRLGFKRCYNVVIPEEAGKDVNEFFWDAETRSQKHTAEDFQKLLDNAKQFDVAGVKSLKELIKDVYNKITSGDEEALKGYATQWPAFNTLIRGMFGGQLVVICSRPKVGKTTWVLNLFDFWSRFLEIPTLLVELEMSTQEIAQKMIKMHDANYDETSMDDFPYRKAFHDAPDCFHVVKPTFDQLELEKMVELITDAVRRYDCKAVCVDNLLFMTRGNDTTELIGQITRRFKMLASELDVVFFLITHPKKVGHNRPLLPDDLKDSSSIFQDLDHLILLHREIVDAEQEALDDGMPGEPDADQNVDSTSMLDSLTHISVVSRHEPGGVCYMHMNGERGIYKDKGLGFARDMKKVKERIQKKSRANRKK